MVPFCAFNETPPSVELSGHWSPSHRVTGCYIAYRWRHQSKSEFLASNRTQKGQTCKAAVVADWPLLLHFLSLPLCRIFADSSSASLSSRPEFHCLGWVHDQLFLEAASSGVTLTCRLLNRFERVTVIWYKHRFVLLELTWLSTPRNMRFSHPDSA